jgi:hypothetical protein
LATYFSFVQTCFIRMPSWHEPQLPPTKAWFFRVICVGTGVSAAARVRS